MTLQGSKTCYFHNDYTAKRVFVTGKKIKEFIEFKFRTKYL